MPQQRTNDARKATSQSNRAAIVDAAERLLQRRVRAGISAVAAEAGLSRVTVYAHFAGSEAILEAVVERAVGRAVTALRAAEPDRGPADEALHRLLAASWEELGHHAEVVREATSELGPEAMRRSHGEGRALLRELIERGRLEGTFRTDLGTDWLLSCFFALIHSARDEVQAGRIPVDSAFEALSTTLTELLAGPGKGAAAAAAAKAG